MFGSPDESKKAYGQTLGLSNLEVKHVSDWLTTIEFIPRKVALISQSVSFVC